MNKHTHGFTLFEVMAACLIVTILAAVALPSAIALRTADQRQNAINTLRSTALMAQKDCVLSFTNSTQGYNFNFSGGTCIFYCYDPTIASPSNGKGYPNCTKGQTDFIYKVGTGCSNYGGTGNGDWACNTTFSNPQYGVQNFTMTGSPPTGVSNTRSYYVDQGPPILLIKYSDCCNTWQPIP